MLAPFRPLARLIAAVLCTSLAVVLIGANAPTFFSSPTLVIFPLRTAEGYNPSDGADYVKTFGTALGALGGVNVVMGNSATVPSDYLRVAKLDGGDYYFMGSIAPPVRNAATVIEQIVSTRSGVVVWSGSAFITAQDDVLNQAPVVKQALVSYTTRSYATILNPTPPKPLRATSTPTPAPKKGSNVAAAGPGGDRPPLKLPNEAYGFSSKPTAPPKVYASSNNPSRFVVLTFVGNNVPSRVRDYAVTSLVAALKHNGQTVAEGDPAAFGRRLPSADVCAQNGASYLVLGSVSASSTEASEDNNYVRKADASINLSLYDCAAGKFVPPAKNLRGSSSVWQKAIDADTNGPVMHYLLKVATVAKSS